MFPVRRSAWDEEVGGCCAGRGEIVGDATPMASQMAKPRIPDIAVMTARAYRRSPLRRIEDLAAAFEMCFAALTG